MASRMTIFAVGMLFFTLMMGGESGGVGGGGGGGGGSSRTKCRFPAIFNFGDSNSDTGAASAAFGEISLPFGMSFRNLSKRGSDGRLILDFIAENLGVPYLDAALDSIGTSFKQGANFATGGAKISPIVITGMTVPLYLDAQVSQFIQFKSRTIAHSHHQPSNNKNNPPLESNLPEPEVFSKALYTIDIGQNDIAGDFYNTSIPIVIDQFSNSLQRLLREGAKYFWIHNTGPHGCEAASINGCKSSDPHCMLDQNGCARRKNEQSQDFNNQLKETIYKLRAQYPDAAFTYVGVYSAKLSMIINAKNHGFEDPLGFCCGKDKVSCGSRRGNDPNNELLGTACNDPSKYISWDGIHYTQAANRFVANLIINGSFSDPPLPVAEACHRQ